MLAVSHLNDLEQLSASQCIVIEDSHWGIQAARAAGIKTIGVTNTYSAEELNGKAAMIVDSLGDLTINNLTALFDNS